MMNRTITLTIVAALLSVPCAVSLADPVDNFMDYRGMGLREKVRLYFAPAGFHGNREQAGQMKIRYNENDYLGYCVDVYHYAGDAQVTAIDPATVTGGSQAAFLFETYGPGVSSKKQAAALQTAMWEVLNESSGTYDIRHGAFRIGGNNQVANLAQSLLDSVPNSYNPAATIILHSACKQDMMISGGQDVPEPTTMALLGLGGLITMVRRRRKA